jgi:hypothetical protein
MTNDRFVVMTSAAHMPASVRGARYRNVAVVRLTDEYARDGLWPKMISNRARGVAYIHRHYGHHFQGISDRCAYRKTLAEAQTEADALNRIETKQSA